MEFVWQSHRPDPFSFVQMEFKYCSNLSNHKEVFFMTPAPLAPKKSNYKNKYSLDSKVLLNAGPLNKIDGGDVVLCLFCILHIIQGGIA